MTKKTESYDDIIADDLQDAAYVTAYLNMALTDPDSRHFLLALRRVAKARKIPMSHLAEELHIHRRGLYHALSNKGNPGWTTLHGILDKLGFHVQLTQKRA